MVPLIIAGDVRWWAIRMLWLDPAKVAERQSYNDVVHMMQKVCGCCQRGGVHEVTVLAHNTHTEWWRLATGVVRACGGHL